MLEASSTFTSLVKVGNRIKLTDNDTPFKTQMIDSDYPQVVILYGDAVHSKKATTLEEVVHDYTINISSNSLYISNVSTIRWEIEKILKQNSRKLVGIENVRSMTIKTTNTVANSDLSRLSGWTFVITVSFTMEFRTSEL